MQRVLCAGYSVPRLRNAQPFFGKTLKQIQFRKYTQQNNNNNNNENKNLNKNKNTNNNGQVLGSIFDIDPNAKYAQPENNFFSNNNNFRNNYYNNNFNKERETKTEEIEGNNFLLYLIFAINAGVFALWHLDEYRDKLKKDFNITIDGFDKRYMMENFTMKVKEIEEKKNLHTLITSMFSHQDIYHFAFNMFTFLSLGQLLRKSGSFKFLQIYLLSGLSSCGLEIINQKYIIPEMKKIHYGDKGFWYKVKNGYFDIQPEAYILGASGSIYGLLTSSVYFMGARNLIFLLPLLCYDGYFYFQSLEIKQKPKNSSNTLISHAGHIGGALAGFIIGFILKTRVRI